MSSLTDAQVQTLLVSSNTQAFLALSDVFFRLECELNQFQPAIRTPKARAAALATVDQDIDAAKRLILSLFTRRNMLVPISILPVEILARIFHLVAFSEHPNSHRPELGSVYFTHVCRRWRQVALDDSTLWTHFSNTPRNKDWIAERLSRARNAPLVIELGRSVVKDTFSLFTPHISHTRELYLYNLSFHHSEVVQEISTQNAPALERLKIGMSISTDPKHLVLQSFFKGPLPKLQILCIVDILFPWSLFPRGRLTELRVTLSEEVSTVTSKVSPHGDLNQLIDLLVNCPALEILTLKNCLPAMVSEFSGGQTIHLPRLSRLHLGGSSSRITDLLKMLKLSSSTKLHLDCMTENTAPHNDHLILPILSAHFNDPTPVKFRSFDITLGPAGDRIDMIASTSLPIRHSRTSEADCDPELHLSSQWIPALSDRVDCDILRRVCGALSLSTLKFLFIYLPDPNPFININWSEMFQDCTAVTTVQVHGRWTIGLLEALTPPKRANTTARGIRGKRKRGDKGRGARAQVPDDDNDGPAPAHVPIFPKLRSLMLKGLDFSDAVPGSGDLYDLILSAVQRRKVNKRPLTTLCITNCVISADQAGKFRSVVRNFCWDRKEDPWGSLRPTRFARGSFHDFDTHYGAEITDTDSSASD